MKRLILFLGLSMTYAGISAQQQYKRCLDGEMTRWSFLDNHVCDGGILSTEIIAYGDTLFNGVVYKQLYIDESFNCFDAEEDNANWKNHTPQLYYEWDSFFIRESEDASKLYIYISYRDEEYLISDMNLQEGDNFRVETPHNGSTDFTVDSVYVKNNLKHIRFLYGSAYYMCIGEISSDNCFYGQDYLTFIESVGSTIWFIYPHFGDCLGLNCFQNQTTFYKNEEILNGIIFANFFCGDIHNYISVTTPVSENYYHIFIQKDNIEILFTSNANVDISIYDMHGKLCYTNNAVSSRKIIIPTSSFPKGVYILKIFNRENFQTNSNKIILQ